MLQASKNSAMRHCSLASSRMGGLRQYATEQAGKSPLFLTNLLNRIDEINATSKRIANNKAPALSKKPVKKTTSKNNNTNNTRTPQPKSPEKSPAQPKPQQASTSRISVKSHPLAFNSFRAMDESNFRPNRPNRPRPDNRPNNNSDNNRPNRPNRPDGPRRFGSNNNGRPKQFGARSRPQIARNQVISNKEITPQPLRPTVTGSVFYHGHPASLITSNVTSAVASVAKRNLIQSNYPYKLPRSVVEAIDPNFHGNRYILQQNWKTSHITAGNLSQQLKSLARGQFQNVTVDKSKYTDKDQLQQAHKVQRELMKNGDYSTAEKRTILNVASGLISPRELVAKAHWNN